MSDGGQGGHPSRARDHMANERTFLSWQRTGAEIMVLGIFIAKVGQATTPSSAAGALLVATGIAGIVYGILRYRRVTNEIEEDRYVTGSRGRGMALAGATLITAVIAALVLVLAGSTSS